MRRTDTRRADDSKREEEEQKKIKDKNKTRMNIYTENI